MGLDRKHATTEPLRARAQAISETAARNGIVKPCYRKNEGRRNEGSTLRRSPMRVLFVTPSELSSGEAITVLHMAERITRRGGSCHVLASSFTADLLEPRLRARVGRFTSDRAKNEALWDAAIRELSPHAIVFADYPLLFFSNGVVPLVSDRWVASLDELDAIPITLDHLGYAQRVMPVSFGPPHLSIHTETTPELPTRMRLLLPCPMNEPSAVVGRRGTAFRYWDLPFGAHELASSSASEEGRLPRRPLQGRDPLLVVHTTPNWSWRIAKRWRLPHHEWLAALLHEWFSGLSRPVTVISVNNGSLLAESDTTSLRIRNSGVLPPDEYERLLAAADLLITDNSVSVTIGRAACALLPVALLQNSRRLPEILEAGEPAGSRLALGMERSRLGSVFRYEAFPIWNADDIENLGLFRDNSVTAAFSRVELFGGDVSRQQLCALLVDASCRAELRARQRQYMERIQELPDAYDVIATLLAADARGGKRASYQEDPCAR